MRRRVDAGVVVVLIDRDKKEFYGSEVKVAPIG
jgi:hypothetical protein